MTTELTKDEIRAIAALERLAQRWPKSLWLFSSSGTLSVMRAGKSGDVVHTADGGIDRSQKVRTIRGVASDGGDW